MRNLESPWNRANVIRKLIGVTAVCIEHFSTFLSKYMSDDADSGVTPASADAAGPRQQHCITRRLPRSAPAPADIDQYFASFFTAFPRYHVVFKKE